ncbi:tetratricopeptide repeat protein [Streptomyces acidiscabies]|uniref:tetratricopeptide repeat protein n=1 Tax=Streptomyces acidiscabies TaxID=42234 RepID=UPI001C4BEE7E|nr:tetratricopeptide repeat protein [Streptomyces acidiscabies]
MLTFRGDLVWGHCVAGAYQRAAALAEALLADQSRVRGREHVTTVGVRAQLAHTWMRSGQHQRAIIGFEELVEIRTRLGGPDHHLALEARASLASALREGVHLERAVAAFEDLVADRTRVLGADHRDTLATRISLAESRRYAGDRIGALRDLKALLSDHERIHGPDHIRTFGVRQYLVWTSSSPAEAARTQEAAERLVADCTRVLGPAHRHTLTARGRLAQVHSAQGRTALALRESTELLADWTRASGADHADVFDLRRSLVWTLRRSGDRLRCLREAEALLADSERVRGESHPRTLDLRIVLACACWQAGDTWRAAQILTEHLARCEAELPEEHPGVFWVRGLLAWLTADAGVPGRAVRTARELVEHARRTFGPGHWYALRLLPVLTHALLQDGARQEAAEVLAELLRHYPGGLPDTARDIARVHEESRPVQEDDEESVRLGRFLDVFATGYEAPLPTLAVLVARTLDSPREAMALLEAVYDGRSRVLGPHHPSTLEALAELAFTCLESGIDEVPEDVVARHAEALGADHPTVQELAWRLRTARPAWRARVTLLTDEPATNTPAHLELRLERQRGRRELARVMVIAGCRTKATVDPPTAEYEPGGALRFELTAREPGAHEVHFTMYDHASGFALQEIKTVVAVSEDSEERKGPAR